MANRIDVAMTRAEAMSLIRIVGIGNASRRSDLADRNGASAVIARIIRIANPELFEAAEKVCPSCGGRVGRHVSENCPARED